MGNDHSSPLDADHAAFQKELVTFLPKATSGGAAADDHHGSGRSEVGAIAVQAIHHMVFDSKKLLEPEAGKPVSAAEKDALCDEIFACARFLAKIGAQLAGGAKLLSTSRSADDPREKQLRDIALFEAPQLGATALAEQGQLERAIDVLKFAVVAQRRYFGGHDALEQAMSLLQFAQLASRCGDKDSAAEFARGGSMMHYRILKAEGKLLNEQLALELNVTGKKLSNLGRFKEAEELERSALSIRVAILSTKTQLAAAASAESTNKRLADAEVAEAKKHLSDSFHALGVTLVRELDNDAAHSEGIDMLRKCVALRTELAQLDGGSNKHHRVDDLAKALKDLGLALQKIDPESAESREVLHRAHVLYEAMVEQERAAIEAGKKQ